MQFSQYSDNWKFKLGLTVFWVILGALAGYLYYKYVGCTSNSCMISSSPIISSLYGALMGFVLGNQFDNKKE